MMEAERVVTEWSVCDDETEGMRRVGSEEESREIASRVPGDKVQYRVITYGPWIDV